MDKQFIDRVIVVLDKPYFKSLDNMGIDDKELIQDIFNKLYNDNVDIDYDIDYDDDYHIYNSNDKQIYSENSRGFWLKREYDDYGNLIYYEDSDGRWMKSEYDDYGNRIYYENSKGYIIDDRNNSINESYDSNFINRVIEVLEKPYFKSLDNMGIDDKDIIQNIFNTIFNVDVYYDDYRIYDDNSNLIYYEDSDGRWFKREYDHNGNEIYYEHSSGYWIKREFDHNGNMLYFEDSDGEIVDNRSGNINESYDSNFINRVIEVLELPYFKSLDSMGIDDKDLIQDIFNTIYNDNVDIDYDDDYDDYNIYNSNGNVLYYEDPNGYWLKREYDENGNLIYNEDSDGQIIDKRNNSINESYDSNFIDRVIDVIELPYFKSLDNMGIDDQDLIQDIFNTIFNDDVEIEYDYDGYNVYYSNDNQIYSEDSGGFWSKREYDENGNRIYYEDSRGYWIKSEYDENGNTIYFEDSDGYWIKREYDDYGNLIYNEDSDGVIEDNRSGNINESYDSNFINRVIEVLDKPYFKSLDNIGIDDKELIQDIFNKLYNDNVDIDYDGDDYDDDYHIYNSNGNEIYYEDSNGYWVKREYDDYGNLIYYEESDGFWFKREYDHNGNEIYYEHSNGYWIKREYDDYGNEIYYEDSRGQIIDKRNNNINESYDSNFINRIIDVLDKPYFKTLDSIGIDDKDIIQDIFNTLYNDNVDIDYDDYNIYNSNDKQIYYEDSNGYWAKREYDDYGNRIYFEDSSGLWVKSEYDENGNRIYYGDSDGVIKDNR